MEQTPKSLKPGWTGRVFEDFQVGDRYRSPYGRTVTEMDNLLITHLTLNTNPLHFDQVLARHSKWEKILVNSTFTLALITGMSVPDVSQNALANLGWEEIKLKNPVFVGDTLYCETEVLALRDTKSYPEAGIVKVRSRGVNQDGKVVIDFTRSILVYRRNKAPQQDFFPKIQEG